MVTDSLDGGISALGTLLQDPTCDVLDLIYGSWIRVHAPIGDVYVAFHAGKVQYVRTAESVGNADSEFLRSYRNRFQYPLQPAARVPAGLLAGLNGRRVTSLRFDLSQGTDFERDVLRVTRQIPAGQTRPYAWIAQQIGRPRAVRAVGTALGKNPVPILIPCHRVTKSTGEPGDYVFGQDMKRRLLLAENVNLDEVLALSRVGVHYIGSATTKIVCFPTCSHARQITSRHRRGYRTVEQALQDGYRPCKRCTPAASVSA